MSRWTRAAAGAAAILLSLSLLISPVAAAGKRSLFERIFNPPSGMEVVSGKPRNALQLRSGKVRLDPRFMRQVVPYSTAEAAGTIVINTGEKHLYLVLGKGKALRYGIGTARSGFEWSGTHRVTNKREWPGWTPPAEMRKRQPGLPAHMPGGINNPLGARALYIGSTLYRIHGTNEPWSIGTNVSSGCIRMVNDDVIDLYERVRIGAKVIVL
jgi:lipoprotein-anchoring transpeptidase ErfK/SrfK